MNERRIREALQRTPVDAEARERSRRVVHAAYRELAPARRPARARRRLAGLALACVAMLALTVVAVTRTPADAVAQWLREAVGIEARDASAVLGDVPGGGRLLVTAGDSAWVVAPDGAKRRLGRYEGASWSPRGLFVVAWQGGELTALEPDGDVRWSLRRPEKVETARWAPGDGYRIAYVAGSSLRVVNGDGTGDRRFGEALAAVAPAWRPGGEHVLAYLDRAGRVRVADADSGRVRWRSDRIDEPTALAWSPRGDRLLVVAAHRMVLFDGRGVQLTTRPLLRSVRAVDVAWSSGREVALVLAYPAENRSDVALLDHVSGRWCVLFTVPGRLGPVAWSPDGRSLLVSWPDANQWLFLRPQGRQRPVRAIEDVAAQFAPGTTRARFPSDVVWAP